MHSGYYYLGIVAKSDLLKGIFDPSYILCQSAGISKNRSGLRVVKANSKMFRVTPKLLIGNINRHQELVDFLSNYRTRDHMHGDKHYGHVSTLKYTPEGAIFWFPCSVNGIPSQYESPIFVKLVPDKSMHYGTDDGFKRLKEALAKTQSYIELLSDEPYGQPYLPSMAKNFTIPQKQTGKGKRKRREKDGRNESL